jgi:diadenosine tetraphosphatase ApaH/serine/threonine PP2A family protein phosphatase
MEPTTATHIQSLEVTEPYKLYSDKPVNDGSSALHHLVKGIDLTRDQFNKYYWDFVKFCYPSSGMSFLAFTDYLTKTGFYGPSVSSNSKKDETIRFFRSFTFLGQPSLSFKEFIMGIIVTDTRLPTTPKLEEIRAQYILAYYAIDAKQGLAKQDLMKLMFDARTTSGSDGLFNQFHVNGFINPANMVNVIGSKEVRGGSSLLRSSYDVKNRPKFVLTSLDESAFTSSDAVVGRSTRTTAVKCSSCQVKRYSIAGHAITIDSKGKLMENKSIDKILPFQAKMRSKAMRTLSNSIFLDAYVPNTTISLIQEFAVIKGILAKASTVKNPRDYLQTTQPASWILKLCDLVEDTFRKQSRLLKISSPTVVFGDIHGNLHDLLIFEHLYWPSGAALHPCNLLFLGDYVDRGLYDLEVILYLFSSMLLAQNHLFMLRGNHETKAVNSQFDFMKHCKERLGSIGQTIYERINRVFDHMPVACVIDDKIFCCHGGVPFGSNATTASLDEINSIPCPLEATEQRDPLAWQILWNDPQENMEFQQTIRENKSSNFMDNAMLIKSGFAPNTKRATGFYFNETAVDNFLTKNGLSHVIRGHECPPEGYRFHHQGKTTTVFSSSGYSLDNQAAVLIVDDNKIRPVMIDTKDK